jgi:hypothetical protein
LILLMTIERGLIVWQVNAVFMNHNLLNLVYPLLSMGFYLLNQVSDLMVPFVIKYLFEFSAASNLLQIDSDDLRFSVMMKITSELFSRQMTENLRYYLSSTNSSNPKTSPPDKSPRSNLWDPCVCYIRNYPLWMTWISSFVGSPYL